MWCNTKTKLIFRSNATKFNRFGEPIARKKAVSESFINVMPMWWVRIRFGKRWSSFSFTTNRCRNWVLTEPLSKSITVKYYQELLRLSELKTNSLTLRLLWTNWTKLVKRARKKKCLKKAFSKKRFKKYNRFSTSRDLHPRS